MEQGIRPQNVQLQHTNFEKKAKQHKKNNTALNETLTIDSHNGTGDQILGFCLLEHFLFLADHYPSSDLTFALQPRAPDEGLGHSFRVLSGSDWLHWDKFDTW